MELKDAPLSDAALDQIDALRCETAMELLPSAIVRPCLRMTPRRDLEVEPRDCAASQHVPGESIRVQRIDRVIARRRSLGRGHNPFGPEVNATARGSLDRRTRYPVKAIAAKHDVTLHRRTVL